MYKNAKNLPTKGIMEINLDIIVKSAMNMTLARPLKRGFIIAAESGREFKLGKE